jgi:hypothetical protein
MILLVDWIAVVMEFLVWAYFHARLAFTIAALNMLARWYGLRPNVYGSVPLSIAELGLQDTNTAGY